LALEDRGEYLQSGRLVGWDSNEELRSMALVCRGWEEAAVAVLHHSVALSGRKAARRFLAMLERRPERAKLVRWIAIGLGEDDEAGAGGRDAILSRREASQALVAVLCALPSVEHLLLRPLDPAARPNLLAFFAGRRRHLKSLVLTARNISDTAGWQGVLQRSDAELVLDGLERLDVDVWRSADPQLNPSPPPLPLPPRLSLTHLCLDADYSPKLTYDLICPTLTHLHLYFEHLRPAQEAALALSKAPALQHLHYICNPAVEVLERDYNSRATPVLDLLLPSLPHLETLFVSATDISPAFLRLLPPKLRHVTIQTCSSFESARASSMLEILRDSSVDTRRLRRLTFRDGAERWKRRAVEMEEVCVRRGICFELLSDGELEG
ncbi:hypothetical protein BCR35DRAFT_306222, partial [Leucosporidium creatinivorum]